MSTLELKIKWYGVIITKNSDRPRQANEMHKKILQALFNSNIEEAIHLMDVHIDEIKHHTIEDYS